jgi:hypothetical protein
MEFTFPGSTPGFSIALVVPADWAADVFHFLQEMDGQG